MLPHSPSDPRPAGGIKKPAVPTKKAHQNAADIVLLTAIRKSIEMLREGRTAEDVRPVLYRAEVVADEVMSYA